MYFQFLVCFFRIGTIYVRNFSLRSNSGEVNSFIIKTVQESDMENYRIGYRYEKSKDMVHVEVREKVKIALPFGALSMELPQVVARSGVRNFSGSSELMDELLRSEYNESGRNVSVALFVYMWVNPKYRRRGLGDLLLNEVAKICFKRGDRYMLLVHDDNGSGKLISYYLNRGFIDVQNFLPKGMLCKFSDIN